MFGKEIFDLIKSGSEKGSVELDALFLQSLKLQEAYNTILPKVTPKLIRDLFARLQENPHIKQPIYMIEIFTKKKERKVEGTITKEEQFREYLISISGGSIPAIYDHNSHYVINMRLTFDILKALNDINFVLEICGDFTGTVTAVGAAREYRPEEVESVLEKQGRLKPHIEEEREHADDRQNQIKPNTIIASEDSNQIGIHFNCSKNRLISNSSYKTTIYALIAIAGVASLVNLIVSGGIMMPNTNIIPPSSSILKQTSDYGIVNGEVTGQSAVVGGSVTVYKNAGLVDSVEKSAGYTEKSVISPDGHFVFKLPSGVYRITVAYPDGKDQIIENYAVWPGSYTSLNLIR
jgi:hypothetical protein